MEPHLQRDRGWEAFPDIVAYFFDIWICQDHESGAVYVIGVNHDQSESFDQRFEDFKARVLKENFDILPELDISPLGYSYSDEAYLSKVQTLLAGIHEGDYYQANLTRRYRMQVNHEDVRGLYHDLRQTSPNPYGCYMEFGDQALLSASPEQFVEIDGEGKMQSRPIKGTRPRQSADQEDVEIDSLMQSSKDKAELSMIVDLIRNDMGRICHAGSVAVPESRYLESHSGVHHTLADVTGSVSLPWSLESVIRALIPGGSITGAPKIAAMEVLSRLEEDSRGFYTGNVLFLDALGKMDSSILIRTLVLNKKELSLQVGGGIVADSVPEDELQETRDKAKAVLDACKLKDSDFHGSERD